MGTNLFFFPTALTKMEGDEWHFGLEADYFGKMKGGIGIDGISTELQKAMNRLHDRP